MIQIHSEDFDIAKIADSGQCFRLTQMSEGRYILVALGKVLYIEDRGGETTLHTTAREYEQLWRDYLDLGTDYRAFRTAVPTTDGFLSSAVQYGQGIRILRQDPWEMLFTFIISQRKSIPAIKGAVELLCQCAGQPIVSDGETYFAFPAANSVAALSLKVLAACSLGYRAPYVLAAAQMVADGGLDLAQLARQGDADVYQALLTVPGVGPKVANCVMLFGYHRLSGFPRDVWINRMIEQEYQGDFPLERYAGFEGVIQQYIFYYARSRAYRGKQP